MCIFFVDWYGDHRDLHVLTHSVPTRRSSDLTALPPNSTVRSRAASYAITAPLRALGATGVESRRQRRPSHSSVSPNGTRSEEHTSELQSLMRNSYAVFCLKKKNKTTTTIQSVNIIHYCISIQ